MHASATYSSSPNSQYDHTQRSPIPWMILIPAAAIAGIVLVAFPDEPTMIALLTVAAVLSVIAFSFHWLRVVDDGAALLLQFGPLPLFRKRIPYANIVAATADRSSLIDGIGIHWVPRRGWTYNIWGFDCVRLTLLSGGTIRVGTDDPRGLAQFLEQKFSPRPS